MSFQSEIHTHNYVCFAYLLYSVDPTYIYIYMLYSQELGPKTEEMKRKPCTVII